MKKPGASNATRTERIIQELEAEILIGDLTPGQRLNEMTLGERFAVSRTPVREALRALATIGPVELQPRIGALDDGEASLGSC
ncbi:MAG: GntR family transcriptional regulator [Paracoccaceae bacterium]|nr:GntR family transcriptional regulator [Paracoccaceae bacterium]